MSTAPHQERLEAVLAAVRASGAASVLDLGCGDGDLLMLLVREAGIRRIAGLDVSAAALRSLRRRLAELPPELAGKVEPIHGSMTQIGPGLRGFEAAVLLETIEHVDPGRLSGLERGLFHDIGARVVIVTTPNAEFNPLLGVPAHRFRHPGHWFEWDRKTFRGWAGGVGRRHGYAVEFYDVAGRHPDLGGSTQMAVFHRQGAGGSGAPG